MTHRQKHFEFPLGTNSKVFNERVFQKALIAAYDGFVTQTQPAVGSDLGIPDLLFYEGRPDGLFPIELKIGRLVKKRVKVTKIRPSQILWAHKIIKAGGSVGFVAGEIDKNTMRWQPIVLDVRKVLKGANDFDEENFTIPKTFKQLFDSAIRYSALARKAM